MTDPIIEAAWVDAALEKFGDALLASTSKWVAMQAVLEAIAPRIEADALEKAAKVADGFTCGACGMDGKCAEAIRRLIPEKEPE